MEVAAVLGKVHLLAWLEANCSNIVWSPKMIDAAAAHGHVPALEWLKAYWIRLDGVQRTERELETLCGATVHVARAGHFENVNRFVVEYTHIGVDALYGALGTGHMEIVKYLYERYRQCLVINPVGSAIEMALRGGCSSLADLEWLHEREFSRATNNSLIVAAERGLTDIVRWLLATYPNILAREALREYLSGPWGGQKKIKHS